MALSTLGGKLLLVGGRLAQAIACCCNRWCRQTGEDQCGNPVYACDGQQQGSIGPCTEECRPPADPCECGPDIQCPVCYECVDRKCDPLANCCADGSPCPPCHKCVDGVCVPCGPCEQCIDGECQPCGPCQKCEDGECTPCDSDEVCIGGVCVPKQYYCCWDDCPCVPDSENPNKCKDSQGNPLPEPTSHCQQTPCGQKNDPEGNPCSLTKSGPYAMLSATTPNNIASACEQNCQKYECGYDACGNRKCKPAANGPYASMSECLQSCPDDPCANPCSLVMTGSQSGAFPDSPTQYSYYRAFYTVDGCERDVCVSYKHNNGAPIRVQIWGPTLNGSCQTVATRVIKTDSQWRCEECCKCQGETPGDSYPSSCNGPPKGKITWSKPRGVTTFEVQVLTCVGDSSFDIDVQACGECQTYTPAPTCPCERDSDCTDDCHCCCNKCQKEPCRTNCDEFANWTLEARFCGHTLVWSADGQGNTGNPNAPFRLDYAGGYLCTARSGGFGWFCGDFPPTLTLDESCFLEQFDENDAPLPNPNAHKCVGQLWLIATAPRPNGAGGFCFRSYQADIIDGELVNITRGQDGDCDCNGSDTIQVTLTYNPLP